MNHKPNPSNTKASSRGGLGNALMDPPRLAKAFVACGVWGTTAHPVKFTCTAACTVSSQ